MLERALDAEARGDAAAALEAHLAGLIVEESLTRHRIQEMVLLGADAPAWMYSRWAVDQTARWMLITEDPRCDEVVRTVLAALHTSEVDRLCKNDLALKEYGSLVASCDWVYRQLAAYECGGLRDFLDARAEPCLLERLDGIDEWERAAATSYEFIATRDDVLEVRRLTDDRVVELLNLGATTDIGPSATVVGRVVPISVWPFAMFESRPLPVDAITAQAVGEAMSRENDLGWFWALAQAHEEGRLPARATWAPSTLWSTDIVPERMSERSSGALSGRMMELMGAGLSEHVANGVCVAEVALIVAEVSGDIGPVSSHLTAVMVDPRVFEALKQHGIREGQAPLWRILAAGTPSPVRDRCLQLASLSERRAS